MDKIVDRAEARQAENDEWRGYLLSDNGKTIWITEQYGDRSWAEAVCGEIADAMMLDYSSIPFSEGGESMGADEVEGDKVEGDKVVQEHPEPDTGNALNGEGEDTDAEAADSPQKAPPNDDAQ